MKIFLSISLAVLFVCLGTFYYGPPHTFDKFIQSDFDLLISRVGAGPQVVPHANGYALRDKVQVTADSGVTTVTLALTADRTISLRVVEDASLAQPTGNEDLFKKAQPIAGQPDTYQVTVPAGGTLGPVHLSAGLRGNNVLSFEPGQVDLGIDVYYPTFFRRLYANTSHVSSSVNIDNWWAK